MQEKQLVIESKLSVQEFHNHSHEKASDSLDDQYKMLLDYILKESIQDVHLEKAAFLVFITAQTIAKTPKVVTSWNELVTLMKSFPSSSILDLFSHL